jgi:cytochrome P450
MASIVSRISEDDFLTPDFFHDPYPFYERLLAESPVVWSQKVNGWLVTPFDSVQQGLQSTDFGAGGRIAQAASLLDPDVCAQNRAVFDCLEAMMSFRDAPDHTRLRRLVSKAFTARRIGSMQSDIETLVNDLLDQWPADRQFDLIQMFSFKLPAMVISQLLGIPFSKLSDLNRWAEGIVNLLSAGVMTPEAARSANEAVIEASEYLESLIKEKEQHPTHDLLSDLIVIENEDGSFSREELIALVIQLFFAGFETTEGLIGNALNILLQQRESYSELVDDPSITEKLTEEVLRFDNSIQRQTRIARKNIEVNEVEIRQGDYVFFLIGAANRDPRRFTNPNHFNPHREDAGNVSFGHGSHFCLGAPLARLETQIALRNIANRFPELRLVGDTQYGNLLAVRKPKRLMLFTQ